MQFNDFCSILVHDHGPGPGTGPSPSPGPNLVPVLDPGPGPIKFLVLALVPVPVPSYFRSRPWSQSWSRYEFWSRHTVLFTQLLNNSFFIQYQLFDTIKMGTICVA